jgi:putative acetyltransferase
MDVRGYCSADLEETAKLFYDTIHSVNAVDYCQAQLDAWAPQNGDLSEWDNRLSNNHSIVVTDNGIIIGFGSADGTGYFDFLYVHKDHQRRGVATLIADNIEMYIFSKGIQTVTTDASVTAKPLFEKRGYILLKEQRVERRGQILVNFRMQKTLQN